MADDTETRPNTQRPRRRVTNNIQPDTTAQDISSSTPKTTQTKATAAVPPVVRNGMSLRPVRDLHPATPDLPATRRSTEVVQAQKKEKAEQKAAGQALKEATIEKNSPT
ncbi:hypothetical protein D9758_004937 [Tetrapyrgos nigripes]|uniref:Uncharacterized protein n=1 Tax=Tetrapyrgos nigripes TaxID=182062 RepID=A0A8H5GWD7_9AGAR|nr:hypothetical protein D9758_004937 [Tetrapyrgos nigripes]